MYLRVTNLFRYRVPKKFNRAGSSQHLVTFPNAHSAVNGQAAFVRWLHPSCHLTSDWKIRAWVTSLMNEMDLKREHSHPHCGCYVRCSLSCMCSGLRLASYPPAGTESCCCPKRGVSASCIFLLVQERLIHSGVWHPVCGGIWHLI